LLFVPYLAWVTVAAALNIAAIRLNPKADGTDALV
jgi:tryptophan-rich sensory protein